MNGLIQGGKPERLKMMRGHESGGVPNLHRAYTMKRTGIILGCGFILASISLYIVLFT